MPILNQSTNPANPPASAGVRATSLSYAEALAKLTADKWELVAEGPSGAQLKKPKKISSGAFIFGVILLFFYWPAGVLIIVAAAVEQAFFTKQPAHFLNRELPTMPSGSGPGSKAAKLILVLAILILGAVIAMQLSGR